MGGIETGETVLVTGGSGFLGGWCIIDLLNRGYRVRTTVRNIAREQEVRTALSAEVEAGDRLASSRPTCRTTVAGAKRSRVATMCCTSPLRFPPSSRTIPTI